MTWSPDLINGLFEFAGACFNGINVWRIYQDKKLAGVSWVPSAFFTSWGIWNLYYYPALDQWWSFGGGCAIVLMNAAWITLALKYRRN